MPDYRFHEDKAAAFSAVAKLIDSLSKDNIHREKLEYNLQIFWEHIDLARDWEVVQHRLTPWINPNEK
jgi:hypothetical protein